MKSRVEEKEGEEESKEEGEEESKEESDEESDEEVEEERGASCGILPRSRDITISRFLLVAISFSGLYKGLLFKSNERVNSNRRIVI